MNEILLQMPTWWMIRIGGFVSYFLLFSGICLGLLYSMPRFRGASKARLYQGHAWATNGGLLLGVVHGMLIVIDTYAPFSWRQVLVPFTAPQHPFWNGLGTLTVYGMLLILLTTDFKSLLSPKLWRYIHLTAYPVFAMAALHGLGAGTDTAVPAIKAFYALTCAIIVVLTILRIRMAVKRTGGRGLEYSAGRGRREAGHADSIQAGPAVSQRGLGAGRGNG